jgi:hypothetical protein
MTLDPEVRDLLETISRAADGIADWRMVAIRSTIGRVLDGRDDPGAAADWLRGFLTGRERVDGPGAAADWLRGFLAGRERAEAGRS